MSTAVSTHFQPHLTIMIGNLNGVPNLDTILNTARLMPYMVKGDVSCTVMCLSYATSIFLLRL